VEHEGSVASAEYVTNADSKQLPKRPEEHNIWQGLLLPAAVLYLPAPQLMQLADELLPLAVAYLPALHPTQVPESTAPKAVEYVPAPQTLAVVKPARIAAHVKNVTGVILI
jgi:hypothetical protein